MWSPKEPDVARQCVELIRDSYSLPGSEEMRFCSRFFGCLIEGGSQTYRRVGDKARDAVMTGAVDRAAWDGRPAAGGVASKNYIPAYGWCLRPIWEWPRCDQAAEQPEPVPPI